VAKDVKRVEIGFGGGQVAATRLTQEQLEGLQKELVSSGKLSGETAGWYELESEDGAMLLDLRQVVFVRVAGGPQAIGFSGS
jgi:hypothetical protein